MIVEDTAEPIFRKERLDDVSKFARMCSRRNLSERGDRIDDLAEQLVMKILMAMRVEYLP